MLRVYGLRRYKQSEDGGSTDITGTNLVTGASIPPFDLLVNSTICTIVKEIQLSRPELAFIIATRAMIGDGIALLLADRLSAEQRKAVGSTLSAEVPATTRTAQSVRESLGGETRRGPLPRSSPRYPAELSQFPEGLFNEAFRKLFRSHSAGGSVRRNSFINLA
jgi:hypothetical protein